MARTSNYTSRRPYGFVFLLHVGVYSPRLRFCVLHVGNGRHHGHEVTEDGGPGPIGLNFHGVPQHCRRELHQRPTQARQGDGVQWRAPHDDAGEGVDNAVLTF